MLRAWFDGACEPKNPGGHATWGFWVEERGEDLANEYGYVGCGPLMTNNVAEYSGAIAAMNWFLLNDLEDRPIVIFGDSNLVVKQMNGEWKTRRVKPGKRPGLYFPYYEKAMELKKSFKRLRFEWVPREENGKADDLSKRWLKENGVPEGFRRKGSAGVLRLQRIEF